MTVLLNDILRFISDIPDITSMSNGTLVKPLCSFCCKEMQFVEGDIIFGEKWYHRDCKKHAVVVKVIV